RRCAERAGAVAHAGGRARRDRRGSLPGGSGNHSSQRHAGPMTFDVTLIPGDGIGPEITEQTVRVLEATGLHFNWDVQRAGMSAVDAGLDPLPDATLASIRQRKLALKGPLTTPVAGGYRSVNVALRKEFDLYANLRPARTLLPARYD